MSDAVCPSCLNKGYHVTIRGDFALADPCPDCVGSCSICHNERTLVRVDDRGYDILVPCRCQPVLDRIGFFNAARIPARYAHCTLEKFNTVGGNRKQVRLAVAKHTQGFQPDSLGLLLWGKAGRGKTHLMVAILRELSLDYGFRTRFIEFSHLLSDIKEGFNQGKSEAEVLGPVTRVPILGVDELGKGLLTEWQLSVLDEVISRRYNQKLTTYFTTNLSLQSSAIPPREPVTKDSKALRRSLEAVVLEDRVGERIFSRLHEMCSFLEVRGPDARREARKPTSIT